MLDNVSVFQKKSLSMNTTEQRQAILSANGSVAVLKNEMVGLKVELQ